MVSTYLYLDSSDFWNELNRVGGILEVQTTEVEEQLKKTYDNLDAMKGRLHDATLKSTTDIARMDASRVKMELNTHKSIAHVKAAIQAGYRIVKMFLRMAGIQINAVLEAAISSTFEIAEIMMTIATAETITVALALRAAATFMAAAMAIGQAISSEVEKQKIQNRLQKAQNEDISLGM